MKKFFIYAYRTLSVIAVVYVLPMFIANIVKDEPSYATAGITIFFCGFFLWGFSYIVEAACLFVKNNDNQ